MEILDTKQAAEYLKHKESTLETWRSTGKGPVWYKPGGKVLYYKTDLDEWIKEGENK
jgi:excisionase family DNA binding protein